jgi:hypothetical protein
MMAIRDLLESARRRLGVAASTQEAADRGPVEHIKLSNPWHAVSILPGPKRCEAVSRIVGERYLSAKAPMLPLKDCTEPACTCRYRHHEDRRLEGAVLDRNGMPLPHPHRRNSD